MATLSRAAASIGIIKMAKTLCRDIGRYKTYSKLFPEAASIETGLISTEEKMSEMYEALKFYKSGIDHFYKCINFGKSNLDAEAISFMNESNIKINKALQ